METNIRTYAGEASVMAWGTQRAT